MTRAPPLVMSIMVAYGGVASIFSPSSRLGGMNGDTASYIEAGGAGGLTAMNF